MPFAISMEGRIAMKSLNIGGRTGEGAWA